MRFFPPPGGRWGYPKGRWEIPRWATPISAPAVSCMQDLPRIGDAIRDGSLSSRSALQELIRAASASGGAVHLMGLMSPGGVHSHQAHMAALARILTARRLMR